MNKVDLLKIIGAACTSLVGYGFVTLILGALLSGGDDYMLPMAAWIVGGIMYAVTVACLFAV